MSTETRFEDGKLYVSRVYEAPREAVFEAWIETKKVQAWWGCAQTVATRSEIEPRVGGCYNHTMTIEGAGEHPGEAVFTIYEPPERLAYSSAPPGGAGPDMVVTVEFSVVEGGTRVELVHEGIPDIEVGPGMQLRSIVREGWTAAFGKLAKFIGASVA